MIYLDNAATSFPKPEPVYRIVEETLRKRGFNPGRGGYQAALELGKDIAAARKSLAEFFGAEGSERIVFTYSATDSINMALKGTLRDGDHVVTTSIEHNAMARPLAAMERAGRIQVTWVPCEDSGFVPPSQLEAAVQNNTRMIAMTHASNVVGTVQAIEDVGPMARKRGLLFLVDAAQTAGVLPIDVHAMQIDFLAFPGHKGLLAPQGIGGLYVREGIETETWREGGTGSQSEDAVQPESFPEHLEAGTGNTSGILALKAGVEWIRERGREAICKQEREHLAHLLEEWSQLSKITIFGCKDSQASVATLSINVEGYEPAEVGTILDQNFDIAVRTGFHCAPFVHRALGCPGGTVRFSPGPFTTDAEIQQVVDAMKEIAS